MPDFFHVKSIAEVHHWYGLKKSVHPLITVIRKWPPIDFNFRATQIK